MSPAQAEKWGVKQRRDWEGGKSEERSFSIVPFTQTVNCVCEPCNNRWMNNIETDAQPFLKSLLIGHGRELHHAGQINVATWATLRVLVLQYTHPNVLTAPRHMYDWLYSHRRREDREPPPHVHVWLGAYSEGSHAPEYVQTGLAMADDLSPSPKPVGFTATFTVGYLVVHVTGFERTREPGKAIESERIRSVLIPVWPQPGRGVKWPPKRVLTPPGVFALSNMFGNPRGGTSTEIDHV